MRDACASRTAHTASESGTVHVAATPIGPFVRRIQPPEPLVRVRSTGGALLAITATGRLFRFTDEAGYQRIDLGDVHAMDVAADLLNDRVLPFFEQQAVPLLRVLTDRGTEYCGSLQHHEYQLYLAFMKVCSPKRM